jgi:hypothetical protein
VLPGTGADHEDAHVTKPTDARSAGVSGGAGLQLPPGSEPGGVQLAPVDHGSDRAARSGAVRAVAEAALGGPLDDVGVGVVQVLATGQRQ